MQQVFIVNEYGCNSTPGDLCIPQSKLFLNYVDAYAYFKSICPSLDDNDDKDDDAYDYVSHYINDTYDPNSETNEYIIIEDRQLKNVKRPWGVVIARHGL